MRALTDIVTTLGRLIAATGCDERLTARRLSRRSMTVVAAVSVAALISAPTASAKEFQPGDLRACNERRCLPITNTDAISALSSFYYTGAQPARARAPQINGPYYELRFRNGYVTGIVASTSLDRFLSYGVNLGRFARATWYRLPTQATLELRKLTRTLKPLRLTAATVESSR